jgi:hypothetical protein
MIHPPTNPVPVEPPEVGVLRNALRGVLDWIESRTTPNDRYAYSRCIVCACPWRGDEPERHNIRCPVPKWRAALLRPVATEGERR